MSWDADHFCIVKLCGGRGGGGGRRVAGKQVHAGTRAGSVCQTAGKQEGCRVGGRWDGGHGGGRGRGCRCVVSACGLVLFLLSQIEFGSAHSFSLL